MAKINKIERIFNMDDLVMLELAQVFHDNFVADKVAFSTAFTDLADPFAANFQTAINDADALPTGAEVDSAITVVTADLNIKMEEGRNAMQKLFTYADITFGSAAKTNTFGKSRYAKSRNNQLRMKELLETAHRTATETANQTALTAKGYTLADIAELATLRDDIDSMNANQEEMKSQRGIKTEARIVAYNDVWGFMHQINQASKVVFATNPAKLTQYLLYPATTTSLPKPQNLTAVPNGADPFIADLNWDAVTGAEGYEIQFSEVVIGQPSATFTQIGTSLVNTFQAPIVPSKRNYWRLRAVNQTQQSTFSDEAFIDGGVV